MLKLYEHPLSPYAQKVKIALYEKGIPFEVETPNFLGGPDGNTEFVRTSPRHEVPSLIDGDTTVFDSTIILEYLEDKWPEPALLPSITLDTRMPMRDRWPAPILLALLLCTPVLAGEKVNLNTATKEQLVAVGLTESQSLQVITHREKNGAFLQVEELLAVAQINKPAVEKVRDRATVDESQESDAPGVQTATMSATDKAQLQHVTAQWQNAYGIVIYTILADVENTSGAPLRYVKVKVLLSENKGQPVAERFGYNMAAEVLRDNQVADSGEEKLKGIPPIPAGGTDHFRLSLDKSDIGKPFRATQVSIVEVR